MESSVTAEGLVETSFTQACARVIDSGDGWVTLGPDTPETVPGNGQYHFLARVLPHAEPLRLRIEWPQRNETPLPGFYYPHNHNFATVLDRICFESADLREWRRVDSAKYTGSGVEISLAPAAEPVFIGTGVPYTAARLIELIDVLRSADHCEVLEIGKSRNGRPLHGVLFPPSSGTACEGVFLLQAYQHHSEWAGLYALEALARGLADGSVERGPFAWALVPCLNIDALFGGWREDLMYAHDGKGKCGNFNRDWCDFVYPEVRAARDFFQAAGVRWPVRHALDFHMGWHSPDTSGGGLSVFVDGVVPEDVAAREQGFAEVFFRKVPIEPFAWSVTRPDRPNFSGWVYREFGTLAQTVEVSRFAGMDEDRNPSPVSQSYYESFGPAAASALRDFHTFEDT